MKLRAIIPKNTPHDVIMAALKSHVSSLEKRLEKLTSRLATLKGERAKEKAKETLGTRSGFLSAKLTT